MTMMMMMTFGKKLIFKAPEHFVYIVRTAHIVVIMKKMKSSPLSIILLNFFTSLTSGFRQKDNVKKIFPTPMNSSGVGPCPDGWLDASFVNMG